MRCIQTKVSLALAENRKKASAQYAQVSTITKSVGIKLLETPGTCTTTTCETASQRMSASTISESRMDKEGTWMSNASSASNRTAAGGDLSDHSPVPANGPTTETLIM